MKNRFTAAIIATLFAACSKETVPSPKIDDQSVRATINYSGDPASDKFGWILRLTPDSFEIPSNLPENFKQEDLVVDVSFKKSAKTFPCRCASPKYFVDIISIAKAAPAQQ